MFTLRNIARNGTGWGTLNTYLKQSKCQQSDAVRSHEVKDSAVRPKYGQPTPTSHSHLLKPGELVPGIELSEFVLRREKLAAGIAERKPGASHIVIIPSAQVQYMSDRIPYFFRQNTDFRYLTGCLEADCVLLLLIGRSGSWLKSILFVRENSNHSQLWEGPRTGSRNAPEMFGVDEAYPLNELTSYLQSALKTINSSSSSTDSSCLWYDYRNPPHDRIHHSALLPLVKNTRLECPTDVIHRLRLIKSEAEQALMKKAGVIGSDAIKECMIATGNRSARTEHELYATVDYHCRMRGAQFLAYPPVVAAANNANIIHYTNNNQQLTPGHLVLMDAGCEVDGYCSDITRSWPVDGKFSEPQLTLYEIVATVQQELLDLCNKSRPTLDRLLTTMTESLGKKLIEAKVLSERAKTMDIKQVVFGLCPHHVSHYLGMDVHDTGSIPRDIPIQPGFCFTVEPGIYIEEKCELTKAEFKGCGIRIEDDVLMTSDGRLHVLSQNCPKTVAHIESSVVGIKS